MIELRKTLMFRNLLSRLLPLLLLAGACTQEKQVRIPLADGTLVLEPVTESAIRVRMGKENAPELEELIFTEKVKGPKFTITKDDGRVVVRTKRMSAEYREDGTLLFRAADGHVLLEEKAGGRKVGEVIEQTFLSPSDEHLYGNGQFQDGHLEIKGLSRRLTQVNSQISVPMILSSRGYGLLWHNYGLTEFNPGDHEAALENVGGTTFVSEIELEENATYSFLLDVGNDMAHKHFLSIDGEVAVDQTNYWLPPTVGFKKDMKAGRHVIEARLSEGDKPTLFWKRDADETTFRSKVGEGLDYTVFAGNADEVMRSLRTLSGHVPPMPDWVFRYIHCRERYASQEELLAAARRFHDEGIPVGTIVQDWQYWGKYGWNAMQFDEDYYPDPKAMTDELHSMDMHLMLSVWSKVDKGSAFGKLLGENGYYIDDTDWVDFFDPEAAACYWKTFRENLLPTGTDAWWQDATEPENDELKGRNELYRNVYPLKVIETVCEGLRKEQKEPVILTRSGFAGMQRYGAITWSGDVGSDWDALRRQITGGLGQMAAGLPWWTCDAGGFFRPGDQYTDAGYQECMVRWIQTAVYFPFMRVHGYMSRTEPWEYSPETERLFREAIARREALLPYILEQAKKVSEEDYTLMRPLIFDFPEDYEALSQETEFMFGTDYLVCPVLKPGIEKLTVYLPVNLGGWEEIHSGEKYDGGSYAEVPVTINDIPVFRRLQLKEKPLYLDESASIEDRVDDLVGRLTDEEKIELLRATSPGVPRLGIPKYYHGNEALHGIVRPGNFTVFPQAIALASTWDPRFHEKVAGVISDEARARWNELGRGRYQHAQFSDLLTFWSPTINMARDPRWGRTPETYGEDPFLAGEMGAAFVRGLQGYDPRYLKVVSTPKHFSGNNEEHNRFECNALISEKHMREYYLPAYESAVKRGHAQSIMSAYNAINGIPCTANKWLLTDVLRDDWGFDGYVVSDCGAVGNLREDHHYVATDEEAAAAALSAGLDLECGDNIYVEPLRNAVREGLVSREDLDRAARNVLTSKMKLGIFDDPSLNPYNKLSPDIIGSKDHKELALEAARKSIVLLKNKDSFLPLDQAKLSSIAVVGLNADVCEFGDYSGIPAGTPVSILDGMKAIAGDKIRHAAWKSGNELSLAAGCDVVVAVMGINKSIEREGKDRTFLGLPEDQEEFLHNLYAANPNVVLVIVAGSSLAIGWEDENIPAIVDAWYPGQQGGTAVAEVLFGRYNPAGRLPLTWYRSIEDLPPFDDYDITKRTYKYFEGPVLYPFGHGLSYTQFEYSDMEVKDAGENVEVSLTLRNVGPMDGDEVVQIYTKLKEYEGRAPVKELRGFSRVHLAKGEKKRVAVPIRREDLRYWSESQGRFVIPEGLPEVYAGPSSADIRLKK